MKTFSLAKLIRPGLRLLFQGQYTLSFDQLEFPLQHLSLRKRLNLLVQGVANQNAASISNRDSADFAN